LLLRDNKQAETPLINLTGHGWLLLWRADETIRRAQIALFWLS